MTLRAPLQTRIERIRQITALQAAQSVWRNPVLNVLSGKDVFFAAPGVGPSYDWPNPQGRQHPVNLRSWSQSLTTSTLEPSDDTPFVQYDYPNPKGRLWAISLRTWTDPIRLNLIDQDEYGQHVEIYNTWVRTPPVVLRTWTSNLLQSTLAIAGPSPFAMLDWPVPKARSSANVLRGWTEPTKLNLLGKDVFYGDPGMGPSYDWPNPKGIQPGVALRAWSNSNVNYIPGVAPVFTGTIPDQRYMWLTGTHTIPTAPYFTGADSYSISPAIEAGWSFSSTTGNLVVDTDEVDTFGPYTITGTNIHGSTVSNGFRVRITYGTFTPDDPVNTNATTDVPTNYEICDRTGFKVKAGTLQKEWNGAMVRPQSWEARHPQDFVRGRPEHHKGSPRPEQDDTFIQDDDQVEKDDL